jgi:hypothetical protein
VVLCLSIVGSKKRSLDPGVCEGAEAGRAGSRDELGLSNTHTHLLGSERELDCTRVSNSKLICLTLNYFLGVVLLYNVICKIL